MLKVLFLLLITGLFAVYAHAADVVVFIGQPEIKISEGGLSRVPETMTAQRTASFRCEIIKRDDKYYWASRNNVELLPVRSGAYLTFLAVNGAGYIRIIIPEFKSAVRAAVIDKQDPEAHFDYVEHLLQGLHSITYFGHAQN